MGAPPAHKRGRPASGRTGSGPMRGGARMMQQARGVLVTLLTGLGVVAGSMPAAAQTADKNPAIFGYKGGDREQRLVEGARAEGGISFYTSNAPADANAIKAAFEKKYGVKVDLWRALAGEVAQRATTEARAKRFTVDVIEMNGGEMESLARDGLTARFYSPHLADLPDWAASDKRAWVSDRAEMYVVGFHSKAVKRDDMPTTYEGLLDPKWKGKLAVETTSDDLFASTIKIWGEQKAMSFWRRLAAMKPDLRAGHALFGQLLASGELTVGIGTYYNSANAAKANGQAIDWIAMDPIVARPQGLGLALNAPHPHGALLFADFVLSQEGQELIKARGQIPSSRKVKSDLQDFN